MIHYINFFFNNIEYDENYYQAEFSSPDVNVHCNFRYNRKTKCCEEIWNYNRPPEEIEPIPVWWLEKKMQENGKLYRCESKISYWYRAFDTAGGSVDLFKKEVKSMNDLANKKDIFNVVKTDEVEALKNSKINK